MNEIIGAALEEARQDFVTRHNDFYKFASTNRDSLQFWLDTAKEDPIDYSVRIAAAKHRIDNEEILEQIRASLKFRVLAGILTRPIDYEDADGISGKLCGCQEYDEEVGGWPCKVPSNQAQADAWHSRFGNSSACPFWKNPQKVNPMERKKTEIEKMLEDDSIDLETAWRQLGLRSK